MAKILIVEDNVDLANVVRSALQLEGHMVDMYHTGEEGLAGIFANPYELIILDWDLPGISGLEILTQFRASRATIPVLMLTGKDAIEEKEAGLDRGADDYITKPFNLKELAARVRATLRRSSAGTNINGGISQIQLDRANLRASRGTRTYALTKHEFDLLELAVGFPHLKPTCQQLLEQIWHDEPEKSEQKVRTTIRRLRKKFDPEGKLIFPQIQIKKSDEPSEATPPDRDDDPLIGSIFNGKYHVEEIIGGGGSGLVYLAEQLPLRTKVALKILHLNVGAQSETAKRFHREAKLASTLSHLNLAAVRDFDFADHGPAFLVMDLLSGASLAELLDGPNKPPASRIVEIFTQVCDGLQHAHDHGLVHRDIKPSNLMITLSSDQMIVKIIDFGLARPIQIDSQEESITQTGDVLGSPLYMSPEQCRGERVDARADIYAMGCAMFEAIEGRPPFTGEHAVEIFIKQVTEPPPKMNLEESDLPASAQRDLAKIISVCLEKDPDKRFQTAAQLKAALNNIPSIKSHKASKVPGNHGNWFEYKKHLITWLGRCS